MVKFDAIMTDIVGPHLDSLTQKYSDVSIYWSLDVEKVLLYTSSAMKFTSHVTSFMKTTFISNYIH